MKLDSTSSQIVIYLWEGILSFYWSSYYIITLVYQYHPSINYTINALVLTSFSTNINSSVYYLYIFIISMTTFSLHQLSIKTAYKKLSVQNELKKPWYYVRWKQLVWLTSEVMFYVFKRSRLLLKPIVARNSGRHPVS